MRKYAILSDKELEANIKTWQGLERDARVHNDPKIADRCQKTINDMQQERDTRRQSA